MLYLARLSVLGYQRDVLDILRVRTRWMISYVGLLVFPALYRHVLKKKTDKQTNKVQQKSIPTPIYSILRVPARQYMFGPNVLAPYTVAYLIKTAYRDYCK